MARSPQSDPQREEAYRWERKFYGTLFNHEMKPRALHKMARHMAESYGVRKPRLLVKRIGREGRIMAMADGQDSIEVNHDMAFFTAHLVAHEMAHVVCHAYGVMEPPHGPTWLGVYLWLMDKYKILPLCASMPSARKAGLKFKHPNKVKPGAL